jgi:hypothetical protein
MWDILVARKKLDVIKSLRTSSELAALLMQQKRNRQQSTEWVRSKYFFTNNTTLGHYNLD